MANQAMYVVKMMSYQIAYLLPFHQPQLMIMKIDDFISRNRYAFNVNDSYTYIDLFFLD
jgi:hypothetical protein